MSGWRRSERGSGVTARAMATRPLSRPSTGRTARVGHARSQGYAAHSFSLTGTVRTGNHPGAAPADAFPVTGVADPKLAAYDELMTDVMRRHQPAGAALAVSKDGRLVYARGFGFADVERREPVLSLFASPA